MTKLPQSASSYHICNAFKSKPTVKIGMSSEHHTSTWPIIRSVLPNLAISSTCISQVSFAYPKTLWIQALYTFLSIWEKFPLTPALDPVPRTWPRHTVLLLLMLLLLLHRHQSSLWTKELIYTFQLIKWANHQLLHSHNFSTQRPINTRNQIHSIAYQMHIAWINWLHWLHLILTEPTPFLQTPHGHFPEFSVDPNPASHFIRFVLRKFTRVTFPPYSFYISESSPPAARPPVSSKLDYQQTTALLVGLPYTLLTKLLWWKEVD